VRDAFSLDPSITHLNNGSFGAVPRPVAEHQRRVRDQAEANPMRFHRVDLAHLKVRAREVAADFLGTRPDEVAMVRNVTESASTVLASLAREGALGPGDVVVLHAQGYESVRRTVSSWCDRTGASYEVVPDVAAYREVLARLDGRARLVVVDRITSPTGTVLPVTEVAAAAHEAGALAFVDAAHAPGQVAVRPAEEGADFWTGTWHKWGFAPRGTTALWVAEPWRERVLPLTTSWNHGQPFPLPFDTHGTDDYSAWLSLEAAVAFWHDAGGLEIGERGRGLLDDGAKLVAAALPEVEAALPATPAPMLRLVPLPDGVADTVQSADALYEALSARRVEVQVVAYDGRGWLRLSGAVYNEPADYERLAEVLPEVLVRR